MEAFELDSLLKQADQSYIEFIRAPSLSVGLYTLAAGSVDGQQPHTEDEVYHIISGRASIIVGEEQRTVQAGSVVFVAAGVEHHFYNIQEGLKTLVFFAPAEYTRT